MSVSLEKFIDLVNGFRTLSEAEKIRHMVWYAHRGFKQDRVKTGDLRACYDILHLKRPNISECLSRAAHSRPPMLLKDSKGYFLEASSLAKLDETYLAAVREPVITIGDELLPQSLFKGTRPYIEKISAQINGCYQFKFYDGCAVMMRRLVESLLIDAFIKAGHDDKIRDGKNFAMLAVIVSKATSQQYIRLARGSDQILEEVKYIGDRAAHSRNYISSAHDVKDLVFKFRTIIAELLNLSDIHPS